MKRKIFFLTLLLLFTTTFTMKANAAGLMVECTGKPLLLNPDGSPQSGSPKECTFYDLVAEARFLMDYITFTLALPIAIVILTYGGIKILLAQEDAGKRTEVKKMMWQVMWGFLVILVAWLIVWTITNALGRKTDSDGNPLNITRFLGQ